MKQKKNVYFFSFFYLIIWTLLVFYPQPFDLVKSVYRVFNHPTNPETEELVFFLENFSSINFCPREIEKFVLNNFPYDYDWNVYGMPWYFPTTEEALKNRKGDCKSHFIVIASAFEKFNIPYDLYISPTHIWINYEKKEETNFEKKAVAILSVNEEKVLKIPEEFDWQHSKKVFKKAAIDSMPIEKKILLIVGLIFSSFFIVIPTTIKKSSLN